MGRTLNGPTTHDVRTTIVIDRTNRTVSIQVDDDVSGCRWFELTMSQDTFLDNLAVLGYQPAKLEQWHGPIGYRHESKTELVLVPEKLRYLPEGRDSEMDIVLADYEVHGWRCTRGSGADYRNHHCFDSKSKRFKVAFHRYVHPETGEVWIP